MYLAWYEYFLIFYNFIQYCFDCGSTQTTWVSVHFGLFLCLQCAGVHRGFGVHISLVRYFPDFQIYSISQLRVLMFSIYRSVNLDSWSHAQLLYVLIGGNSRARQHFAQLPKYGQPQEKYTSVPAIEYKAMLQKEHDEMYVLFLFMRVVS